MRTIRCLTTGLALLSLLPVAASAQVGRNFKDAWFWGAKAGNMTFWTPRVNHGQAQFAGAEWLITRERGALLVSGDRTLFGSWFDMNDGENTSVSGQTVIMTGMTRVSASMVAFPFSVGGLRPYAGLGVAFNWVQWRVPAGSLAISEEVEDKASRIAPIWTAGVQAQYRRFSVFGQGTVQTTKSNFLMTHSMYVVEGGIRWNVGSSRSGL